MTVTHNTCYGCSRMLDFLLMLWVKLPFIDTIYPRSNNFVTGVENKATGGSKLNNSPELACNIVRKVALYSVVKTRMECSSQEYLM